MVAFPSFFRTHPPLPSCSLWYSTACVLCALLAMPGAQNLSFATVSGSAILGSRDLTNNCATGGLVCCCLFVFVSRQLPALAELRFLPKLWKF